MTEIFIANPLMRAAALLLIVGVGCAGSSHGLSPRRATPSSPVPEPSVAEAMPTKPAPLRAAVVEASASPDSAASVPRPASWHEVFPHVRYDAQGHAVAFDATVCVDAAHADDPATFLEVLVCIPSTREHETLLVTSAIPSQIHAALLLAGLTPGHPGGWELVGDDLRPLPPEGAYLSIEIHWNRGDEGAMAPIESWVGRVTDQAALGSSVAKAGGSWVFAGSFLKVRRGVERYEADGGGNVVGLTTFGDEMIAWSAVISPDAATEEPSWIARRGVIPARGTPVEVVIKAANRDTSANHD